MHQYADLRQEYGFKNLAIRNRLVDSPAGRVSFLSEEDSKLYSKLASTSFGILVALHELLGHGSGKHLSELTEGQFNFDRKAPPINPLTEEQVESWYKVGETFKSVFGWSYEECRCELVGLYLSFFPEVWQVFQGVAEGFDREDGKI